MTEQIKKKSTAYEIYREILDQDLIEDRREYDKEDLQSAYPDLLPYEVNNLHSMIQGEFDDLPQLSQIKPELLRDYLVDFEGAEFEGFEPEEFGTLQALLFDIHRYCKYA